MGTLLPVLNLFLQSDVAGKMDFGYETLDTCKPALSTNCSGCFIANQVQLLKRSRYEDIYHPMISSKINRFTIKIYNHDLQSRFTKKEAMI